MSFMAPLFSARARGRRAALRALRAQLPDATVELVVPFPLADVAEGEYRQPHLLAATAAGITVRSLAGAVHTTLTWAQVPPITTAFAVAPTPIAVMTIAGREFLGVHGSGTFGLSPAQFRRAVRRIERRRPA